MGFGGMGPSVLCSPSISFLILTPPPYCRPPAGEPVPVAKKGGDTVIGGERSGGRRHGAGAASNAHRRWGQAVSCACELPAGHQSQPAATWGCSRCTANPSCSAPSLPSPTLPPPAPLWAGTMNGSGMLLMEAQRVGRDTTLSQIVQLVENAQLSKAPIQALADRLSAVFVPICIVAALTTFFAWCAAAWAWSTALERLCCCAAVKLHLCAAPPPLLSPLLITPLPPRSRARCRCRRLGAGLTGAFPSDWIPAGSNAFLFALLFGIAVVVIACPCALGLATPTALMVGTGGRVEGGGSCELSRHMPVHSSLRRLQHSVHLLAPRHPSPPHTTPRYPTTVPPPPAAGVAAQNGILIKSAEALEKVAALTTIVFDKTGTLTAGRPTVVDMLLVAGAGVAAAASGVSAPEVGAESHPAA